MAADVGEIARLHPHAAPGAALAKRGLETVALAVAHEIAERSIVVVEIAGLALQQAIESERIAIGPIRQQDYVLSVVRERLGVARLDDQRAVESKLLLEA